MGLLDETIGRIHPLDREAMYKAQKRWDDLYVGVGDLGKLEEMVMQELQGRYYPRFLNAVWWWLVRIMACIVRKYLLTPSLQQ